MDTPERNPHGIEDLVILRAIQVSKSVMIQNRASGIALRYGGIVQRTNYHADPVNFWASPSLLGALNTDVRATLVDCKCSMILIKYVVLNDSPTQAANTICAGSIGPHKTIVLMLVFRRRKQLSFDWGRKEHALIVCFSFRLPSPTDINLRSEGLLRKSASSMT
ncbi:hypothetical protein ARMGADRAFT_1079590 [Armillaria gallica]|uniref:Uncharacterized protein n=1 Tax=Armillaria gallica TaxID=47427 RepID=A0A2H3DRN0_ARMGA|nr:hypothetical protein ARMGADRAFT_1079590 [Armillaria gallica]